MNYEVSAALDKAEITVGTDGKREVALRINGITRALNRVPGGASLDCYLTTTVQTDYEHHSLVEVHVLGQVNGIDVVIHLDGREVAARQIEFAPSSAAAPGGRG